MELKSGKAAVMMTLAALMLAGCASSAVAPTGVATASPRVSASAEPVPLTVQEVAAHIGTANPNREIDMASGHWLYPNDVNNTIVYDRKVVVHGHPVTAALSQNGLHYAYTLAQDLSIYVDGRVVATGTYIPEVFAVSDDGATVLYSDSNAAGNAGVIYRNGVAVFRARYGIGQAVGSADAMHYTAVVDGVPLSLVHDGQAVATSGITGMSTPLISPDGSHYGVESTGQTGGVSSVEGVAVLPGTDWGLSGEVTNSGHWAILDIPQNWKPVVDGTARGASANQVVISPDGREVALDTDAGAVLLNGVQVATVRIQAAWLEIEAGTLYVYSIVA